MCKGDGKGVWPHALGKGGDHPTKSRGEKGVVRPRGNAQVSGKIGKGHAGAANAKSKKEAPKTKAELDSDLDAYFTGKPSCEVIVVTAGAVKAPSGPVVVLPSSSPFATRMKGAPPDGKQLDAQLDRYMDNTKAVELSAAAAVDPPGLQDVSAAEGEK